ncbi:MAG: hypothetical protein CVU89_14615 [Firmicutes bacterium HGW-Firmicutes-14]|nr:MAG: hypothetical protein CVU89_14615 [Firmicutes bacterium HGW-Firmicutes-14]
MNLENSVAGQNKKLPAKKLLAARIISRVAEPVIWLPLMIWMVLKNVNLTVGEQTAYYPVLLVFVFVIPFGYFMYLVLIKKEFDIDVSQRDKRIEFTLKSMVSFAFAVLLTFFMDRELFVITLAVFLSTLSLVLITVKWKISFHGGLNTLIFCTVNYIYGWRFWWLFLLLIPIGWARLAMNKHNPLQLAAGIAVCAAVFFLVTGVY